MKILYSKKYSLIIKFIIVCINILICICYKISVRSSVPGTGTSPMVHIDERGRRERFLSEKEGDFDLE